MMNAFFFGLFTWICFEKGKCKYSKSDPAAQAVNYVSLPVDEDTLKAAVATIGPVAVGKYFRLV